MADETIETLKVTIGELETKVGALSKSAATYRVQRNTSLREAHALRTIAKAHSVSIDDVLADDKLSVLTIADGKVSGEFEYTAPKLGNPTKRTVETPKNQAVGLTEDAIKNMSPAEINKRWDEVSEFLKT